MNHTAATPKQFAEIRDLEPAELEAQVLAWWQDNQIFEQSIAARNEAPVFSFYEGPPTANGRPGIHHVLGRTIKDVFCRYKTLKGYRVERKAGWDTHGLPVEIEVEKSLGLEGHAQVQAYGIGRYNQACRDSVSRYQRDWDELTRRIGYWVDLEHPYVTCHTDYIESVWWIVKRLHEQGLLYRGHKIQWYSPGSNTVLSSHEVSLGYKEVNDPSLYLRFRDKADPGLSYLVWTTTPWTLPSNVALAVHPSVDYVEVRLPEQRGAERLILAAARLEALRSEYEVVRSFKGAALVDQRYEPLYRIDPNCTDANAWRIVGAEFVSTTDGTGVVHIAPAFGADDYEVANAAGLPLVNPVGPDGRFLNQLDLVAGLWFKDADRGILRDLRSRGISYREETNLHNYPHDWRKGTPLMSYPVESWFVRTSALKEQLVALNRTINWYPPSIRDGRFGDWLENNVDWALSRKRFWGTPLPIWQSDKPGSEQFEVIGSIAELREKCGAQIPSDAVLDLHRPFVDELTWPAPDGGVMRRVEDVMDVWFDSGAMPYAQWHYPFENRDRFESSFPADFICEGLDQTRGWFYTLHAIATLVRGSVAYRNVIVNGLVLDENGEKMSKSKGNTVEPMAILDRYGADVLRWYMLNNSKPWENMRFSERGLLDTRRRFFDTLRNVYSFFASYANIDGFVYTEDCLPFAARTELDRWILSRLNGCIEFVDEALGRYEVTEAVRALEQFVDDLSNWYIRRSRQRFWKNKKARADGGISDHDKIAAYQTTCECLEAIAKLISPVAPFFAEWLYRALNAVTGRDPFISVHLASMPEADSSERDATLERWMEQARTVVTLALLLRNQHRINVRRPLARLLVAASGGIEPDVLERVQDVIKEEVNVHEIEFIDDSNAIIKRSAKPLFRRLGPRLGKNMAAATEIIKAWTGAEIAAFMECGYAMLAFDGEPLRIEADDVEIVSEQIGDWAVAQDGPVTVALDTHVTEELRQQGLAREIVNRIQNMRKNNRLNLTDRIAVRYLASDGLSPTLDLHRDWIMGETLALSLESEPAPSGEFIDTYQIDELTLTVAISRAHSTPGRTEHAP